MKELEKIIKQNPEETEVEADKGAVHQLYLLGSWLVVLF